MDGRLAGRGIAVAALASALLVLPTAAPAGAAVRDVAVFACAPGLTTQFNDIGGSTHEQSIACAVHYDLTGGTTTTTFTPGATVSRGQMATFIARLLGLFDVPPGAFPRTGFNDIAGSRHEGSIEAIVELEIAQGTSPTTFSPEAPVSRAQMATFLRRAMDVLGIAAPPDGEDAFDDDDGNSHETAIQAIALDGVAGGTAPRAYSPETTVSRGAMTSFLVRVIDLGIEVGVFPPYIESISFAALAGSAVVPGPGDTDGAGTVELLTTDVPGVLCVGFDIRGIGPTTSLTLHRGAANATGPTLATLPSPAPGAPSTTCISDPDVDAVATNPGDFYVSVQSSEFPNGALRGQLGTPTVGADGVMQDLEVVPGPGDEEAIGAALVFTTTQPQTLCTTVFVLSNSPVTAAHIHEGARHANGPEVLAVPVSAIDEESGAVDGLGVHCHLTAVADEVAANPAAFYVDVHTQAFPNGAVRGQLELDPSFDPVGGGLVRN